VELPSDISSPRSTDAGSCLPRCESSAIDRFAAFFELLDSIESKGRENDAAIAQLRASLAKEA
jgi:hypothetical protein